MDKLFLIDGHALIFKMYYAFLRRPMINSKGADMSILYGFTKYLLAPEWLVRRSLKALFHGRRTFSPGLTNLLLPPRIALLPACLIDYLGLKWIRKES